MSNSIFRHVNATTIATLLVINNSRFLCHDCRYIFSQRIALVQREEASRRVLLRKIPAVFGNNRVHAVRAVHGLLITYSTDRAESFYNGEWLLRVICEYRNTMVQQHDAVYRHSEDCPRHHGTSMTCNNVQNILSKKVTHNFDWFYPMCVYVNYV